MSYRGFGPASPYRKGIGFIARTCYVLTGSKHEPVECVHLTTLVTLRAMLSEMTGRSEQGIVDDIYEKLHEIRTERVRDEMPRP